MFQFLRHRVAEEILKIHAKEKVFFCRGCFFSFFLYFMGAREKEPERARERMSGGGRL
jgi:hypothetical protein